MSTEQGHPPEPGVPTGEPIGRPPAVNPHGTEIAGCPVIVIAVHERIQSR